MSDPRVNQALERFERVTRQLDSRDGASREAAKRERQRLNAGLFSTLRNVSLGIVGIAAVTVAVGLFVAPIGLFGLLAAIAAAIALVVYFGLRGVSGPRLPEVSVEASNATMVQQFDSFLFRSRRLLPASAQGELDRMCAAMPGLRETLGRLPDHDPGAQDARRLMSNHLPGLVERYLNVPAAFRDRADGEGKSVGERLVEGLRAGREALEGIAEQLANQDIAALETQGRFIESRYRDSDEVAS